MVFTRFFPNFLTKRFLEATYVIALLRNVQSRTSSVVEMSILIRMILFNYWRNSAPLDVPINANNRLWLVRALKLQ